MTSWLGLAQAPNGARTSTPLRTPPPCPSSIEEEGTPNTDRLNIDPLHNPGG